jgi:hypothetical protein
LNFHGHSLGAQARGEGVCLGPSEARLHRTRSLLDDTLGIGKAKLGFFPNGFDRSDA